MNTRKRQGWDNAPDWATVLLVSPCGKDYIFASSFKDGADAYPPIMGEGPFRLFASCWRLVEYKPSENDSAGAVASAFDAQVGGGHYKDLGIQPLELTLKNMGLEAFEGACYTKINKYMIRNKDDKAEQLKKARHVLDMWIEEIDK